MVKQWLLRWFLKQLSDGEVLTATGIWLQICGEGMSTEFDFNSVNIQKRLASRTEQMVCCHSVAVFSQAGFTQMRVSPLLYSIFDVFVYILNIMSKYTPGPTFSKFLRKIFARFLI